MPSFSNLTHMAAQQESRIRDEAFPVAVLDDRRFRNLLPDADEAEGRADGGERRGRGEGGGTGGTLGSGEETGVEGGELGSEIGARDATRVERRLALPLEEAFLGAGLALKDEVVHATWQHRRPPRGSKTDPFLYTGLLGTAFVCLRAFHVTRSSADLDLAADITRAAAELAERQHRVYYSFFCGQPGIFALGAVVAHLQRRQHDSEKFLRRFLDLVTEALPALSQRPSSTNDIAPAGIPYELLYGRAGLLWAALFIRQHLGRAAVPDSRYWGAAHGLAGIAHTLLLGAGHMGQVGQVGRVGEVAAAEAEEGAGEEGREAAEEGGGEAVAVLEWMVGGRLPSGNYPSSDEKRLAAAGSHPSRQHLLAAAVAAGEVAWQRGLLRKMGLCHGIAGNAYAFLSLHRAASALHATSLQETTTSALPPPSTHLHRAHAFAAFLLAHRQRLAHAALLHCGDRPFSLMEGLGGVACLFLHLVRPEDARFPGFEL
ncbi:unnamed protein product [Closterium sp. NIES-65]|nr:unnamed protein product [Closterium sp. NIES-65]